MSGDKLLATLEGVLEDLLAATAASRVTLRVDSSEHGFHVNLPVAEALAPDVKSLKSEGSLDQRAADTVKWLERERRPLIQNDVYTDGPRPPQALIDVYGARAQMLGPLFAREQLTGWISVHQTGAPREWRNEDIAALSRAVKKVHRALYGVP